MESKINMFKKVTALTGDEAAPKAKKIQSGNKGKKKKGDSVAELPFNMVSRINHFHELGFIDPIIMDYTKKGGKNAN